MVVSFFKYATASRPFSASKISYPSPSISARIARFISESSTIRILCFVLISVLFILLLFSNQLVQCPAYLIQVDGFYKMGIHSCTMRFAISSANTLAVMAIMGTVSPSGRPLQERILFAASSPSISGIIMSIRMASKQPGG